jgi:hypothetical protein
MLPTVDRKLAASVAKSECHWVEWTDSDTDALSDIIHQMMPSCACRFSFDNTPYSSVEELQTEYAKGFIRVPDSRHPHLGGLYDRYRAVHDALHHCQLKLNFDLVGELTSWVLFDRELVKRDAPMIVRKFVRSDVALYNWMRLSGATPVYPRLYDINIPGFELL